MPGKIPENAPVYRATYNVVKYFSEDRRSKGDERIVLCHPTNDPDAALDFVRAATGSDTDHMFDMIEIHEWEVERKDSCSRVVYREARDPATSEWIRSPEFTDSFMLLMAQYSRGQMQLVGLDMSDRPLIDQDWRS